MNINHDDLSRLYRAYLKTRPPKTGELCPGPRNIWLFFDPKTRKRQKTRILRHVGKCACCAEDFQIIGEIHRETVNFLKEIENLTGMDKTKATRESCFQGKSKEYSPRFRWAIIGSITILLALVGAMIFRAKYSVSSYHESMRKEFQPDILLISPANQSVIKRDLLRFRWSKDPLSDAYVVELFDESLSRIWKSQLVSETELIAPREIRNALELSNRYLWMVTGYRRSGQNIESALSVFQIIQ
jgi:hypothetical protein